MRCAVAAICRWRRAKRISHSPHSKLQPSRAHNERKQLVVGIVWLGFAALTIAIFAVEGSTALAIPYPRLASIGVTVDLFIALALVSIWMYFDARKRGKSAIPFILMALVFGSLGPLTYLFLRLGDSRAEPIFRVEHRPLEAK